MPGWYIGEVEIPGADSEGRIVARHRPEYYRRAIMGSAWTMLLTPLAGLLVSRDLGFLSLAFAAGLTGFAIMALAALRADRSNSGRQVVLDLTRSMIIFEGFPSGLSSSAPHEAPLDHVERIVFRGEFFHSATVIIHDPEAGRRCSFTIPASFENRIRLQHALSAVLPDRVHVIWYDRPGGARKLLALIVLGTILIFFAVAAIVLIFWP